MRGLAVFGGEQPDGLPVCAACSASPAWDGGCRAGAARGLRRVV